MWQHCDEKLTLIFPERVTPILLWRLAFMYFQQSLLSSYVRLCFTILLMTLRPWQNGHQFAGRSGHGGAVVPLPGFAIGETCL